MFLNPKFGPALVLGLACLLPASDLTAKSYLVDFGTSQSFRGVEAASPDANGNHWNGIPRPSSQLNGLIDTTGQTNAVLSIGFSTAFGADSYNGPAGATSNPPTAAEIAATDIDAAALGPLGVKEAAIDYVATPTDAVGSVTRGDFRFAIQGLDPLLTYNLVLFGSQKFNTDSTTVYEAYTDSGYTLLSTSAQLDVHTPGSPGLHNRSRVATLANVRPNDAGAIYLRVRGSNGGAGYLNSMQIIEGVRPIDGRGIVYVNVKNPSTGLDIVSPAGGAALMDANTAQSNLRGHWYLLCRADTSIVYIRNRITGEALRAASDTGTVAAAAWNPDDPRQTWKLETLTIAGGTVSRLRIDGTQAALTAGANGAAPTVSAADTSNIAQNWILPGLARGAALSWTTYDEDNYKTLIAPASVIRSPYSEGPVPLAAEAQKRGIILLNDYDTYAQWTAASAADVLTLRYSVADGDSGTITLRVTNGSGQVTTKKVPVTSAQAWVYFDAQGTEYQSAATGRTPAKRYNEARIKLDTALQAGDTIEFRRETGDAMTWIDLVEAETAEFVAMPDASVYLDVKNYGAVGDGVANDTVAVKNCIADAVASGMRVYLPAGTYRLEEQITLPAGTTLQGAGMWKTEFIFSKFATTAYAGQALGGLNATGSNTTIRDLYLKSAQSARSMGYKGLKGSWGTGSLIENVWVDQAEVGAWIADFTSNASIYTDGLVMRNCRVRNTFADGINYASGTRNSVVENCHIRGAGDDGVASWASGRDVGKPTTLNQQFRYNTIECVYRAGGIGVFGGEGHEIHHNIVRDQVAGPGLRLNTIFVYANGIQTGYPFGSQLIQFYENTLERTGSLTVFNEQSAAIELQTWYTDVENIRFTDINIDTTRYQGVRFSKLGTVTPAPVFANILFTRLSFAGVPLGTLIAVGATGTAAFDAPTSSGGVSNQSSGFTVTGAPPPAPTLTSFSPSAAAVGSTVTLTGTYLGSTSAVQFGAQSAALFTVVSDTTVTAVVPAGAVDARITVVTAGGSATSDAILVVPQQNKAPVVTLGMPAAVTLPAGSGLQLAAMASDDNLPEPPALTYRWTTVSSPAGGVATFDDATQPGTGVTFNLAGTYLLRLTVSDGQLTTAADVTVAHGVAASGIGQDIGTAGLAGSSSKTNDVWTLAGSGADIWDTADGFHFRYAALQGDGFIQVRLLGQTNTDPWAKAGIMIRDELTAGSTHVMLAGTTANGLALQSRPAAGGVSLHQALGTYSYPVWLRLVRTGLNIAAFTSSDGSTWTQAGTSLAPAMSGTVYIGLAVTSHNNAALSTATFDNLQGSGFGTPALSVLAGTDITVNAGELVPLAGTAIGAVSTEWQQVSGPGTLVFGAAGSPSTSVTAQAAGTYIIRLVAYDGTIRTFDELVLTVEDSTKIPASISLSGLAATTYDGTPKSAAATTDPAGLNVDITYNGSSTPPTAAGSYAVLANINDAIYRGTAGGTLVIAKAPAAVELGGLSATYDGNQKTATAATTPGDLGVNFTYNGSATAPINAGTYAITATVNDANYQGSASGIMVIGKATAAVTLGNLAQTYSDGTKSASATTTPAGLNVNFTYNGSSDAPANVGTYTVVATVNDPNYQGSTGSSLVIGKGTATVTLGGLSATYDGTRKTVTAVTDPAGLPLDIAYGGSPTAPTDVGTYPVTAVVNDTNYTGSASGNLVIALKANVVAKGMALVDFGTTPTTSPVNGLYWNNYKTLNSTLTNLVTTNNLPTGYVLSTTNGSFGGGWVPVTTASMGFFNVVNAATDGLYLNTGTTRSVKISGLNTNNAYNFGLYGGRNATETRITTYKTRGAATNSTTLKTSGTAIGAGGVNYNNTTFATLANIVPDATGTIYVDYTATTGSQGYLNAMSIEEVIPDTNSPTASTQEFLVDFGPTATTNAASGKIWNNFTTPGTVLTNLVDSGGTNTGYRLEFVTAATVNPDATIVPSAALGVFNETNVVTDWAYVQNTTTNGSTFKISGLNRSNSYTFALYGARNATETRVTTYTVTGSNNLSGALTTSGTNVGGTGINYNATNILTLSNIVPDTNGEIFVNYRATMGTFGYVNALRVTAPIATNASVATNLYQATIDRWKAQDLLSPPSANAVLFVGSSSIRRWERLTRDFADYNVIQRGFGGGDFVELNGFVNDIVIPYSPRAIVVWAGVNDIYKGRTGLHVFQQYQTFVAAVQAALPGTDIFYIGMTKNPGTAADTAKQTERLDANSRIAAHIQSSGNAKLHYIDLPSFFEGMTAAQLWNYYVDDLHLNTAGYAVWKNQIRASLVDFVAPDKVYQANALTPQPGEKILFDFGPSNSADGDHTSSPDANGKTWNNWHAAIGGSDVNSGEKISGLADTTGAPTGTSLIITGGFASNGKRSGGLTSPDAGLLGAFGVASATEDFFFSTADGMSGGGSDDLPGGFMLTGLDPNLRYNFRFFGSRAAVSGGIRRTIYNVAGTNEGSATLQTSDNIANIAEVNAIQPNQFGEIFIDLTAEQIADNTFAYINAMEMTAASPMSASYSAWAARQALTPGVNDDPVHVNPASGKPNYYHFAFDLDASGGGGMAGTQSTELVQTNGSTYLAVTVPVRRGAIFSGQPPTSAAVDGVIYQVIGEADLQGGAVLSAEEIATGSTNQLAPLGDYNGDGLTDCEFRRFRLVDPVSSLPKGFIRIRVSPAP